MACAFQSWPWERTATLLQWGRVVRGENNLGAHGVRGDLQRFDIYLFFTKFARLFLLNLWDDVAFFVNLGDAGLALMLNMGEGDNYRCEGVFASEELRPRMVFPIRPCLWPGIIPGHKQGRMGKITAKIEKSFRFS